ncbi:hypothetical protein [Runella sp.]|uniref:hypothetical protein n=1 Tax=Runella sp. TaxID=1960881 RepID=UPI003D0B8653
MKQLCHLLIAGLLPGIFALTAVAQKPIQALINVENQFATFTSTHSIKEGFLKYLDSSGVVFNQGKTINGIEYYRKAPDKSPVLFWQPSFSVISASGDLGMNTGPYTVKSPQKDSVVARGNFSSIWKKNSAGEFKLLIDLGNAYKEPHSPVTAVKEISLQHSFSNSNYKDALSLEESINQSITSNGWNALLPHLHSTAHFNLPGKQPINDQKILKETLQKLPLPGTLKVLDGGISKAGDLAYVYGSVASGTKTGNYLRLWIKENNNWKLILQTLD